MLLASSSRLLGGSDRPESAIAAIS